MPLFVVILIRIVGALVLVIDLSFLVRALLSWFPVSEDNPILAFCAMVTEPIIMPVRALFEKMNWFQNTPLDISFLVAYLLFTMVTSFLHFV